MGFKIVNRLKKALTSPPARDPTPRPPPTPLPSSKPKETLAWGLVGYEFNKDGTVKRSLCNYR